MGTKGGAGLLALVQGCSEGTVMASATQTSGFTTLFTAEAAMTADLAQMEALDFAHPPAAYFFGFETTDETLYANTVTTFNKLDADISYEIGNG